MSIIYMNGWDYLPDNLGIGDTDLHTFLTADASYSFSFQGTVPGAFGGTALRQQSNFFNAYNQSLLDTFSGGAVMGWRMRYEGTVANINLIDSVANVVVCAVEFDSNGQVIVRVSGKTYKTRAAAFLINTWIYVQYKWLNGFFELKLNGDIFIQSTDVGIVLSNFDSWGIQGIATAGSVCSVDDMYILDPSDGPDNIDYLGNILVGCNLPIANGSHIDLTPVGVSQNWQAGIDWRLNSATYDFTTTVGDYDLYEMQSGAATRQIFGIQLKGAFTQDNGIQLYGKNQMKLGSTLYSGTQRGLNQVNYGTINDYFDKNPDTGVAWLTSDLAAMECGPLLAASD